MGSNRKLVCEIPLGPEFHGCEFALHDTTAESLSTVAQILRRDVNANRLPARVTSSLERREALAGMRYAVCCVRFGGLPAFASDIEIPLQYGVDQCVGDTICAGGMMYGQCPIPALLDCCRNTPTPFPAPGRAWLR